MPRSLMTDVIEIWNAVPETTQYGEVIVKLEDAVLEATGYGSLQFYFSAEYDVDRDTTQVLGRVISDDPALYQALKPKSWIKVAGVFYEADGYPQKWTLRGNHHLEQNVKKVEG